VITGHLGVAAAARSFSRDPMGSILFVALLLAALAPDVVDALYWAIGFCSPYGLYSHTTYAVALEAAIVGGVAFLATGSRGLTLMFVMVVLLHSAADYFTAWKLFVPGGELVGFKLYERPMVDWVLEVPLVIAGWWLLRRGGKSPHWATSVWAMVALVVVQTSLDAYAMGHREGLKPNACPVVTSPVGP
jgi:ABC-type sugar transport system permease subunit